MIRAGSPPALVTPTGRDHRRDGTITTHYTRPASRRNCRACGQYTYTATCRTCAAWMRAYRHHVAMTAALREARYG